MKKMLFFAAIALAALGSCTSDEFVGENNPNEQKDNGSIVFGTGVKAVTRAKTGAEAAELLNKNFVVEGIKTIPGDPNPSKVEVFDNYNVNYEENTADKTASNTANWEYVAQSILTGKTDISEQTIKYWDFAASQYDFWAYSIGNGNATVSALEPNATLTSSAYTIEGTKADLAKVYVSDLVTAYAASQNVSGKPVMGNEVVLSFRSLVTKARVGIYETIPGYSVKEVKFYTSATASLATDGTENNVTLFTSENKLPTVDATSSNAKFIVSFPTIGKTNASDADYNKAHVTLDASGTKTSTVTFGRLSYGAKHKFEKTTGDIWLRINSATPTWAVETSATAGDYSIVLPNETGEVLTLKVDYTLESIDGSGETITIHGATALVPSQYTQWKPNYAYTYLFKISDNTNGLTNTSVDKVGLYPITLDAVVEGATDGTQETITTVATPSITTYSITSNVTTNNEYKTTDDIYVTATENGTLLDMTGKATLYTVTKTGVTSFTEADVLAALNKYTSLTSGKYVGRNSISLDPVSGGLNLTNTEIPLVDGNKITGLTAGQVALIDKSKLLAGTYAFVYETTTNTSTNIDKYEAVSASTLTVGTTDVSSYYTYGVTSGTGTELDPYEYGYTAASGTALENTTYYEKYTETNNTYAIKVIKVVAGS